MLVRVGFLWGALSALLLNACSPGTGTNPDAADAGPAKDVPMPALAADISCFSPGSTWRPQTLASDVGVTQSVEMRTTPLGGDEGEIAAEVELSIWFDNTNDGTADAQGVTGNDGTVSMTVPTCQALTVRAVRDPDTEVTFKANLVVDPTLNAADVTVVETLTSASIKAILNETIDNSSSLVAGTAYDCAGEPIVGVRARVRDANGNLIEEARDYYFNDRNLPTRRQTQPYTNTDGKWVVFNLPVGEVFVEIYANQCDGDDCEEIILGGTKLVSEGDSVNIGNVHAGVEQGVYFPASCLNEAMQ